MIVSHLKACHLQKKIFLFVVCLLQVHELMPSGHIYPYGKGERGVCTLGACHHSDPLESLGCLAVICGVVFGLPGVFALSDHIYFQLGWMKVLHPAPRVSYHFSFLFEVIC